MCAYSCVNQIVFISEWLAETDRIMLFKAQSRLSSYNNYCMWQVNMPNFAGKSNAGLPCNKTKFFLIFVFCFFTLV